MAKIFVSIIAFIYGLSVFSQDCPFAKGEFINLQTKQRGKVCFSKTPENTESTYSSTYSISDLKANDLYNVKITVNKDVKSIDVKITDIATGIAQHHSLSYKSNYSLKIIANYIFNDTLIDTAKFYNILFTIPDVSEPYVSLNEFTSQDGSMLFRLEPIRAVYINKHLSDSRSYYRSIWSDSISKQDRHKTTLCQPCIDSLKIAMDIYTEKLLDRVADSMAKEESKIVNADPDLQNRFNRKLESLLRLHLDSLKCSNGTIDNMITVTVNSSGVISGGKDVYYAPNSSNEFPQFEKMWNNNIKGEIAGLSFPAERRDISRDDLYENFIGLYYATCEKLDPSMKSFADFLRLKKIRLDTYKNKIVDLPTKYQYNLHFESKTSAQTWVLKKKILLTDVTKGEPKDRITDESLTHPFFSRLKKVKNGRYKVIVCADRKFDEDKSITIDSVKRKYIFYTHIGASAGVLFPLSGGRYNSSFGDFITIDGFVIYHHFGVFGGSAVYTKNNDSPVYLEGGAYLGPTNYLFFKVGYTQLIAQNPVTGQGNTTIYPGFLAGVSLIFPVFHIEGGYNFTFNAIYVTAGFNIPLNK